MSPERASTTKSRRKSFGFFSRPTILQELSDSTTNTTPRSYQNIMDSSEFRAPRNRPKSLMFGPGSGGITQELSATISLPSPRGKVLTKGPRPKSVFGSFGSLKPKEVNFVTISSESSGSSSAASCHENDAENVPEPSTAILHHGEALTTGGLLRRRKEYLVLTTKELRRYKSQQKAWENLGTISVKPRTPTTTHRTASFGSQTDLYGSDNVVALLSQIVAVYAPEADVNYSAVQVDYIDEYEAPASNVFQLQTKEEAQEWLESIRKAASAAREASLEALISMNTITHIARRLEAERDYAPDQFFRVYRVVQRGLNGKSHQRSSSDDLHKMYSSVCYLAIGIHKIHIVPIPKVPSNRSVSSLLLTGTTLSFGILNLCSMNMSTTDDSFSLAFR